MQTANDRNGSSNTTIISTSISTTTIENDNNPNSTVTQHLSQPQPQPHSHLQHHHQPHSPMQTAAAAETTNVLRHRVTNSSNNGIAATKNDLWHLIDAGECIGSNAERVPVTASPSPQASPARSSKLKADLLKLAAAGGVGMHSIVISTPLQHTYKTNTSSASSPSKVASNSSSTTSSVIATPVLKRNGDIFICKEQIESANDKDATEESSANLRRIMTTTAVAEAIDDNDEGKKMQMITSECVSVAESDGASEHCQLFRECNNKQLLTNQMLPYESASPTRAINPELSSSPLPMSPSTTSLSITTISGTDIEKPSLPSLTSSSSASTASTTPASATTTPALLTTTSFSSSSSSSSSLQASSSSSSLPPSPSSAKSKTKGLSISGLVEADLLHWQDMPQYLQFNPYVLKGYRPLSTFKGCLLSLFYWHNETINILTHAIPIVYILAIVPGLMPWGSGYRFLSFCHVFGAVSPWCGSFVYHLFMNIEQGENVYNRLLKLDMVGIWVSQSFGALPLVTASTFCLPFKWKWFTIISYCLVSLWGLYKALTASSPWQRRLCFALPFAMRSVLTYFRTIGIVGGNRVALAHVFLQDGVSIVGGAIGAMRIPEKWYPGLVDFYLNSHNIMHVLVVVAVYSMYKATMKDFEWMETVNCDAFLNITSKVLESTLNTKVDL